MGSRTMLLGGMLAVSLTACGQNAVTTVAFERHMEVWGTQRALAELGRFTPLSPAKASAGGSMQASVTLPHGIDPARVDAIVRKAREIGLNYSSSESRTVRTAPSWHLWIDTNPRS